MIRTLLNWKESDLIFWVYLSSLLFVLTSVHYSVRFTKRAEVEWSNHSSQNENIQAIVNRRGTHRLGLFMDNLWIFQVCRRFFCHWKQLNAPHFRLYLHILAGREFFFHCVTKQSAKEWHVKFDTQLYENYISVRCVNNYSIFYLCLT